uniref:LIM domain containing preferred translocation partner in lipoma n=1 Tax=Xiphophorus couchianus TaxID=32473 RepID=A0A3B5LJ98_9TELE
YNHPSCYLLKSGQVAARMETTPSLGSASISVSQQQAPKKFAPMVAPKPKFNPYKQMGDAADYPPPPPPAEEFTGFPSPPGSFPPPPTDYSFDYQRPEKTLEERRSSLDAEIDSLTSILEDLESSSPYKPRGTQNAGSSAGSTPNAPVTGYKRMVIPNQPQPTFNVQVRSAQPGPQHQAPAGHHYGQQLIRGPAQVQYMPAQPRGPDFAYGPPQPGFSPMAYQEQQYPGGPQLGGVSSRRPDLDPAPAYQPPGPRKTYITDVPPSLAPYTAGPDVQPKVRLSLSSSTNLALDLDYCNHNLGLCRIFKMLLKTFNLIQNTLVSINHVYLHKAH